MSTSLKNSFLTLPASFSPSLEPPGNGSSTNFPLTPFPLYLHMATMSSSPLCSSPNYSYNMMLNRLLNPPYTHGLNSPLPPPILGANAASPPRKLPLIMASYVPPRVPHVLLLPPLIEPSALLVTSGKNPHCHMTRSGSPFSLPIPLTVIPSLNVPPLLDASLYHAVITSPDSAPPILRLAHMPSHYHPSSGKSLSEHSHPHRFSPPTVVSLHSQGRPG